MLLGILVVAGIMATSAYAVTSISDVSHASTLSNQIDIEKKSESMNAYFDGTNIHVKNTGKYDSEIAMFRFYDESGTEVHRVVIPDENGRIFGANSPVVSDSALTSDDAHLPSHTLQSFPLDEVGIDSLDGITGEIVTKRGRTFPISLSNSYSEKPGEDGTGDGTAVLDALGVSLAIHNIITSGMVYFGNGITGFHTDTRPYVGVGPNDDWAVAIADDDLTTILSVPEFAKEYRYDGDSLADVTADASNILGYVDSQSMSGSNVIGITHDGITISGTGTRVIKRMYQPSRTNQHYYTKRSKIN